MHPYHRTTPYRPPAFAPSGDADAPIQLPVDLPPAQLANALHARLTQLAAGRDLRVLRRQAREGFRTVMRHARVRRLAGYRSAPLDLQRAEPRRVAVPRRRPRRRNTGYR